MWNGKKGTYRLDFLELLYHLGIKLCGDEAKVE